MAANRAFVLSFALQAVNVVAGDTAIPVTGSYVLFDGNTGELLIPVYPGGGNVVGLFGSDFVTGDPSLTYTDTNWQQLATNTIRNSNHENDSSIQVTFIF